MSVTRVPGVLAGHWTHDRTGVTALLFPAGARAGVFVPGGAPGSRELGLLAPTHLAGEIHGLCLSGGSAFGLAAADGVVGWLAEQGVGFPVGPAVVPLVPAAILYDLDQGPVRPDRSSGYAAAAAASSAPLAHGSVGAGRGATVAKCTATPQPGGLGTLSSQQGPHWVGVVVAVNALGSVWDPDSAAWVRGGPPDLERGWAQAGTNTTLAAVCTDAPLTKAQCTQLARMAGAGMARALIPVFTPFDGDTVFAVSTGTEGQISPTQLLGLGHVAADLVARAIVQSVDG